MVLITDTQNELTFNLKVEGSTLKDTKAFLTFQTKGKNLQLPVNISETGACKVEVPSNLLENKQTGTMLLEVITKNTVFTPWSEKFIYHNEVKPAKTIQENKKKQTKVDNKLVMESVSKLVKSKNFKKLDAEQQKIVTESLVKTILKPKVNKK
jgi:hypothetical protein